MWRSQCISGPLFTGTLTHFLLQPPIQLGCLDFSDSKTNHWHAVDFHHLLHCSFQCLNRHVSTHLASIYARVPSTSPFCPNATLHHVLILARHFLLPLVVCWVFVVRMGTLAVCRPRPDPRECTAPVVLAFSIENTSCWMGRCGNWSEKSEHSDQISSYGL